MANKVVISADGMCDITPELKEQYGVHYFPYFIHFRGKDYRDNIDIFCDEIFEGYYEDGSLPKTASSSIEDYVDYFKELTEGGNEVVHLSLGGAITSGCEHAMLAAEQVPGVHVVDSHNLSSGLGQLTIRAGRLAQQGLSAKEIAEEAKKIVPRIHSSFVIDTMEFLVAGGRCPALAAKAAGMLKCHPSIDVDNKDGSLKLGKIYRGKMQKVLQKYVADQLTKWGELEEDDLFVTNSGGLTDEELQATMEEIKKHTNFKNIHELRSSCTCSSHCGPRTLGVLFVSKN